MNDLAKSQPKRFDIKNLFSDGYANFSYCKRSQIYNFLIQCPAWL